MTDASGLQVSGKLGFYKLHCWSLRPGIGCQYFSFFVYKGHLWHCFPSVPSVEVMTCDTVQCPQILDNNRSWTDTVLDPMRLCGGFGHFCSVSWYVVDTSHENKHPVGVGKSTSGITAPLCYLVHNTSYRQRLGYGADSMGKVLASVKVLQGLCQPERKN